MPTHGLIFALAGLIVWGSGTPDLDYADLSWTNTFVWFDGGSSYIALWESVWASQWEFEEIDNTFSFGFGNSDSARVQGQTRFCI